MRSFTSVSWFALVPLLAGCQGVALPSNANSAGNSRIEVDNVGPPNLGVKTRIVLTLWNQRLQVGDSSYEAQQMFPESHRLLERNDLPSGFARPYQARAWEAKDDGFGAILYEGRVAAAVATLGGATQASLSEVITSEERAMPDLRPKVVNGKHTVYRFYEDGPQRLMICWFQNAERTELAIAMGDEKVMDAIGASPEAAEKDATRVDQIIDSANVEQNSQ